MTKISIGCLFFCSVLVSGCLEPSDEFELELELDEEWIMGESEGVDDFLAENEEELGDDKEWGDDEDATPVTPLVDHFVFTEEKPVGFNAEDTDDHFNPGDGVGFSRDSQRPASCPACSAAEPAEPADPGDPGQPATPANPANPAWPDILVGDTSLGPGKSKKLGAGAGSEEGFDPECVDMDCP